MTDEQGEEVVLDHQAAQLTLTGRPLEKVFDEERNIVTTVTKGGDRNLQDVEPVIEVLPEPARATKNLEILIRRADHPHVHMDGTAAAHRADLPFLEHPQELGLRGEGEISDLVEEEGAGVGLLEQPLAIPVGTGEGTADMAEDLALEQ
jgi:hypothetical protein